MDDVTSYSYNLNFVHLQGELKNFGAKFMGKVVNAPPGRECTPRGKARVQSFEEIGEIWTVGV